MREVKRIEAKGILRELKEFAFEGNHDFQHGNVAGIKTQKTFYYPPKSITDKDGNVYTPFRQTTVGFSADRHNEKIRNHPGYVYSLFACSERTIQQIPDHIWREISEDDDEQFDTLEEIDTDSLTESATVSLETSDIEQGEITVSHLYEINYHDTPLYAVNDDHILYETSGSFVTIPPIESDDDREQFFIRESIEQERLGDFDRLIDDLAFRAIIDPFETGQYETVVGFRDAAARMRAIMDIMRHGVNVQSLYDLR